MKKNKIKKIKNYNVLHNGLGFKFIRLNYKINSYISLI